MQDLIDRSHKKLETLWSIEDALLRSDELEKELQAERDKSAELQRRVDEHIMVHRNTVLDMQ